MEVQIKRAIKAGNSSAVVLPRAWLNKEIRVELLRKDENTILAETLEILRKYIGLSEVVGVYLAGSYARWEEELDSDIDLLVITEKTDREMISEGIYNILIVSKELLKQKLERDLLPVGQMIREAKALLNEGYLKGIDVKVTRKNVGWYLKTTDEKLNVIKKMLDKTRAERLSDRIAYTLVLRLRTLQIIEGLIEKKEYSKKEFVWLVKKVSGSNGAYEGYARVKNGSAEMNEIKKEEAQRLCDYLEERLEKVRKIVNK